MQGISESKGTCCSKGCCSSSICLCFNLWYFIQSAQICPGYIKRQKNNMWGPAGPILQVTLVSGVSSYIAFILQRHVCKANAETTRNPFFSTHHHFTCRMNPQPMKTSRRYMTRCSVQCQSVYIFFFLPLRCFNGTRFHKLWFKQQCICSGQPPPQGFQEYARGLQSVYIIYIFVIHVSCVWRFFCDKSCCKLLRQYHTRL